MWLAPEPWLILYARVLSDASISLTTAVPSDGSVIELSVSPNIKYPSGACDPETASVQVIVTFW